MTEEKDFWINKAEVYVLSNAEGTAYKVEQEMMNKRGWYKLADDEQIVKKVELTEEEAEWLEENKRLPSPNYNINLKFFRRLDEQATKYPDLDRWAFTKRIMKAYVLGSYVVKERKYYIKLNFGYEYLRVDRYDGSWCWGGRLPTEFGWSQFTQDEINEMQKDPRVKGLDLNALKVEVPEDELEG